MFKIQPESYEVRVGSNKECKELRLRHGISLDDMESMYGYPQSVLLNWEERGLTDYPNAIKYLYFRMATDQCSSPFEFALSEILNEYSFLKKSEYVHSILEKWSVFEILGEDVDEWKNKNRENRENND